MRMKKRILAILLAGMMLCTAGCGQAEGTSENIVESGNSAAGNAEKSTSEGSISEDTASVESDAAGGGQNDSTAAVDAATVISGLDYNVPDDDYRTTYEIFVYSFADSDGEGIGDLNGITEKLDYLNDGDPETERDLEVNQIWLTPVFPSPTYHKYDATDYYDIDEQFGTLEDYENLLQECHARGIRVLMDLAVNHTSSEHPWFTEAAEYLQSHEASEIISNNTDSTADNIAETAEGSTEDSTEDSAADTLNVTFTEEALAECPTLAYYNFSLASLDGWNQLEGTDWYYESQFWSGMPDLNLDSDAVRSEIAAITQFWLNEGVDGFRLDAVSYYYSGAASNNIDFLSWLNEMVKTQKKDAYLVAECWENQSVYAGYYESGVDSFFDFGFSGQDGIIANVVRGSKGADYYASALETEEELYASYSDDYINAPFYTNHDLARSAGYYAYDDGSKTKLAQALNLLMTGNATIYYGEEIGMKGSGKDENKRAPMLWSSTDSDVEGTCTGPADMDNFDMKFDGVLEQQADITSIWNYVREVIAVRNAFPAIARGTTTVIDELTDKNVCVFTRDADAYASVMILINTSEEEQEISLADTDYAGTEIAASLITGDEAVTQDGDTVILPAGGIAVIEKL